MRKDDEIERCTVTIADRLFGAEVRWRYNYPCIAVQGGGVMTRGEVVPVEVRPGFAVFEDDKALINMSELRKLLAGEVVSVRFSLRSDFSRDFYQTFGRYPDSRGAVQIADSAQMHRVARRLTHCAACDSALTACPTCGCDTVHCAGCGTRRLPHVPPGTQPSALTGGDGRLCGR